MLHYRNYFLPSHVHVWYDNANMYHNYVVLVSKDVTDATLGALAKNPVRSCLHHHTSLKLFFFWPEPTAPWTTHFRSMDAILSFFHSFSSPRCCAILPRSYRGKGQHPMRWLVAEPSSDGPLAEIFRGFPLPLDKCYDICIQPPPPVSLHRPISSWWQRHNSLKLVLPLSMAPWKTGQWFILPSSVFES